MKLVIPESGNIADLKQQMRKEMLDRGISMEGSRMATTTAFCYPGPMGHIEGYVDINMSKKGFGDRRITGVTVNMGWKKCKVFPIRKGDMIDMDAICAYIKERVEQDIQAANAGKVAEQRAVMNAKAQREELAPVAALHTGMNDRFERFGGSLLGKQDFVNNNSAIVTRREDGTYRVKLEAHFENAEEVVAFIQQYIRLKEA